MTRSRLWLGALAAFVIAVAAGFFVHALVEGPADPAEEPSKVDIGFAQDMAVHHEQAVLIADQALQVGGPLTKAISTSIVRTQSQEIGMLRGWLVLWDEPQLPSGEPMAWSDHGHAHGGGDHEGMPGMASAADLDRLSTLQGEAFDALFVKIMTAHHQGGIEMADEAAQQASTSYVRQLARKITRDQAQEIAELAAIKGQ